MAALETIRVKFGVVITVLIAVALLSFIIDPTTLQSVSSSMSSKYDVGEIDGKSISYTDFQEDIDKFTAINEIMSGSSAQNEQQQISIRNAAWQSLVDKYLFEKNAKKAGIFVGTEEMKDIIAGNISSPVFTQNPMFLDENGAFSVDLVNEFVSYMESDQTGRFQLYWDYLIESAMTQGYYLKYGSLFTSGDFANPLTIANQIADNNNTFDVEFVMLPYGYAKDSTIVVSDSEIKAYYESHKDFYKQQASRDIEYVVFEVKPSEDDIAAANQALIDVYENFKTTDNLKSFLLANSDRQYDAHWYKAGELTSVAKAVNDYAFSEDASVSEVITNGNSFYAVRVIEEAMVPEQIQVKYAATEEELADAEPQWISQTVGFEDLMTVKKGEKVTINGLIFEVLDTQEPVAKKRVAILEKTAIASKETVNEYYSQANTFATKTAGKYENFEAALDEMSVYAHPVSKMLESANTLGSISNTKEVTRWAFDAKPGTASNIITVDNNYFIIAALTAVHEEGYTPLAEVSSTIRNILYSDKLAEKKLAEVNEQINGLTDLQAIATALNTTVSTREGLSFAATAGQSLDPKFIGAASVSEVGKLSKPIAGDIAVYVYKVTNRETASFYTEEDAKARDAQMSQYSSQMIVPVMMLDAEVKDNRARFF